MKNGALSGSCRLLFSLFFASKLFVAPVSDEHHEDEQLDGYLNNYTAFYAIALLISSTSFPTSCWVRPTFNSSRAMYSSTS